MVIKQQQQQTEKDKSLNTSAVVSTSNELVFPEQRSIAIYFNSVITTKPLRTYVELHS